MLKIGICDDEVIHRRKIRELCEQFIEKNKQECEYVEFSSGEEVLDYEGAKIHLLFLDVELGGVDGVEVLRRIEMTEGVWRVVFVSSHGEAVWNALGLKTLDFARKPIDYQQVDKWIRIALRENQENVVFEFVTPERKIYKAIGEIYYLVAEGNYTYLHGKSEKWFINDKLKTWQVKMRQTSILRIHKSYLVNMTYIRRWESDKVILENGIILPVGRQYAKESKDIYYNYARKHALGRI